MRTGRAKGLFRPARPEAEPWTIVMPPPNVTGSLHIGHALDNTLQDILIRHARLQGKDALWVVGMDHAGIATQMVVERQLDRAPAEAHRFHPRGVRRQGLGVEGGERRRDHPPAAPARRLAATGRTSASPWTRASAARCSRCSSISTTSKLLYRDKRLVNWDPGLKTAISDLEVETTEVKGKFWHFRYPLEDGSGAISVATTRPETMLADMAVAVHPEDERYAALVGKKVRLPITGRLVPIIADEHADPGARLGRGQDHAGPRFQRFRGRQARRLQARRDAQHARCRGARWSRPPTA